MPSPVAHMGAALAVTLALSDPGARVPMRVLVAASVASVAPDLDLLIAVFGGGLFDGGGLDWHRGPTHSIVGATLLGAICAGVANVRGWAAWLTILCAAHLHVLFDWSTGDPGAPAHYGVPWAWPFSAEKSIDPTPWFGAYRIDDAGFLANMWAPHALPIYLGELGTVVLLVGLATGARAARGRRVGAGR
ncbi:MAG: metal-dependent hydrolase [Pseudomonadota bacterium]|nr:metal-dependent hydrolase [Pseudomonadota bacterium]